MKTYRSSTGQFSERPFYTDEDVERMCGDALKLNGLMPTQPEKVRIDRFVEKHFKIGISYESLIDDGVLGYTKFGQKGVVSVHIDDPVDRTVSAERRVRSTLAHEAGHGLMHTHLFCTEFNHRGLFGSDPDVSQEKVLCRDGDATSQRSGYAGRWWELQANMAIGALLMPRELLIIAVEPYLEGTGFFQMVSLKEGRREEAVRATSDIFDVNPAVARIRIEKIFKKNNSRQLTL